MTNHYQLLIETPEANLSGRHTMAAIAAHFGMHYTTVSRLVKAYKTGK
jgi:AraC-like DNA-binding protein